MINTDLKATVLAITPLMMEGNLTVKKKDSSSETK